MRLSLFLFIHLVALGILLLVHPHAKAAGEWLVEDVGSHIITSVSGEVIHGDKLKFILKILLFELRKLGENIFAKLALIPISILL